MKSLVTTTLLVAVYFSCWCGVEAFSVQSSATTTKASTTSFSSNIVPNNGGVALDHKAPKEAKEVQSTLLRPEQQHRPLQQNWWPVAAINTLDRTKPNALVVLNKNLVAWYDEYETKWYCHEDLCPHRFVPLSEGRIIDDDVAFNNDNKKKKCLSCSYHGWQFNSDGACTKIPQQQRPMDDSSLPNSKKKATTTTRTSINAYPTQESCGILWVWTDPIDINSSLERLLPESVPLPISPLLSEWCKQHPDTIYQRDLPYGYELLGENVIDISHLAWSHHGLISFRTDAGPLPIKMLSQAEKDNVWHQRHLGSSPFVDSSVEKCLPVFQAEIMEPHKHDTVINWDFKRFNSSNNIKKNVQQQQQPDEIWYSDMGFYPPSHVRYHRSPTKSSSDNHLDSSTELFICPTSTGNSRVIIFNPFELALAESSSSSTSSSSSSSKQQKRKQPAKMQSIGRFLLRKIIKMTAFGVPAHHFTSDVFDGDNIFLAQQSKLLKKNRLSYKDYVTASSADTMSFAFRKWLDEAVNVTRTRGGAAKNSISSSSSKGIVEAVVGGSTSSSSSTTSDENSPLQQDRKAVILDRYHSHTARCPLCSKALAKLERREGFLNKKILPSMYGMIGASAFSSLVSGSIILGKFGGIGGGGGIVGGDAAFFALSSLARRIAKLSLSMFVSYVMVAVVLNKYAARLRNGIQKFYFVDYDHSKVDD